MRNIKLIIEYDGTLFHGWQIQNDARTVQGELQKALEKLTGNYIKITGASRTDAGVHALGQVANFHTDSSIPVNKIKSALNALTDKDISIVDIEETTPDFNSRFSAKGKIYAYQFWLGISPIRRFTHWFIKGSIDIDSMKKAANYFIGHHNFNAFRAADCDRKNPCLEIKLCEIKTGIPENNVALIIAGPAFLKYMVRIIAGTLLYVGKGKIAPDDIPDILKNGKRELAGITAPAHGLFLMKVFY